LMCTVRDGNTMVRCVNDIINTGRVKDSKTFTGYNAQ
jgi:hypothetical protein